MKKNRILILLSCVLALLLWSAGNPAVSGATKGWDANPKAAFDAGKLSDMSDFDPATWKGPEGDVIKIAYVNAFSGPAAINGYLHFAPIAFAAHDINKRGGIWVDGKKTGHGDKGDHKSRPDICKRSASEWSCRRKFMFTMGTSGSH